jgi:mono/diheme cytochrome c family protein
MRDRVLLAGLCLALLASCGESEKKSRGLDYMPEMYNTPAYKSQGVVVITAGDGDKKSVRYVPAMLAPPAGTVARDGAAYGIEAKDFAAASALANPLAPTGAVLRAGQKGFNTFCAACHGLDGNSANGFVASTKEHPERLNGAPSVNGVNVLRMSDGDIYHIITVGRNRMQQNAAQLPSAERWAVVHYLRALARASVAVSDAEGQLARLEKEAQQGPKANDPYAKAELEAQRAAVAQRKRDLELIRKGAASAEEFAPMPKPHPEYETPTWETEQ